jgi:YidC/Oxa1 family membrane protein insertase
VDRRIIVAIVLMLVVAVLPSILFPPKPGKRVGGQADSSNAASDTVATRIDTPSRSPAYPPARLPAPVPAATSAAAETVWVTTPSSRFGFSTGGGQLVVAELLKYKSFARADSGRPVQLIPAHRPVLATRLVAGNDTVTLSDWSFVPSVPALQVDREHTRLTFSADRQGAHVTIEYVFDPDGHRFEAIGRVTGLGPTGAVLVVGLGEGLRSVEWDSTDDFHHYAVITKTTKTQSTSFQSLDPGEQKILDGPFEWVALKSKYFLLAALALEQNHPKFAASIAVGGPRQGKTATRAAVSLMLPVTPAGDFRFQMYVGPLEYRRLVSIGHDLDDANPYGGFLRPLIQPVTSLVENVLLWMHERLHLPYGWVLVIFGIVVRLVLWPLNQRAMESSMRMQAAAPMIEATKTRYKDDPERLQREMLKVYKEQQVNPFGGCLPLLLPMPVLFALFFVFANTIEFRGVPFLWLPDLSRADPYYIIPLMMGLSMFVLSKVGQMGVPPNPQAKMMLYFMPIFMTVLFLNFASGLNLYYAVSNIFSIPQQYLIARRRLQQQNRST